MVILNKLVVVVIGPDRDRNIDLTTKKLSLTEMSQQRALWLGWSL